MLDLVIEIAIKSAFVSALALALVTLLRKSPAAQRALIAHLGLGLSLLTPIFALWGPKLEMTGPWSRVMPAATSAPVNSGDFANITAALPSHQVAAAPQAGDIAFFVYALVAAALLIALCLGLWRLLRLQRDAAVLTEPNWLCALAEAQHRMGLKHGTALLCSSKLASPVSWGLLRPTIMLSPAALDASDKAEAILAHELAHVARFDWLNMLIARLACALYWFNPIVWVLAWQAHELREEAADDVVLRGRVRGSDYASLLMGFARAGHTPSIVAHGVTPHKNFLRRRLERVLDGNARRDPAHPLWGGACAAIALAIAAPVAAFTPVDHAAPSVTPRAVLGERHIDVALTAPGATYNEEGIDEARIEASVDAAMHAREDEHDDTDGALILAQAQDRELDGGRRLVREDRLSAHALAQLRTFNITPRWLDEMEREIPNVRALPIDDIVALAALEVSPAYLRSLRQAGYGGLDIDEIKAFAAHQISPAFINELAAAGYPDLSADELISLRVAGIDTAYIRSMESAGLRIERRDTRPRARRAGPSPSASPGPSPPPLPPNPPPAEH